MEKRIIHIEESPSTNLRLLELALQGAPGGSVLLARRQSAGMGRQGRSFASPEGGLYMSYLHRPGSPISCPGELTAAAAVASARALERICGVSPGIKWVNDLVLDGRKLGGILCQARPCPEGMAYVIGIGINLNSGAESFPPELRSVAGSLLSLRGIETDIPRLALALTEELDSLLGSGCLEEYRRRCISPGCRLLVRQGKREFTAFAEAIDGEYRLVLRHADGSREALAFGEVSTGIMEP